MPILPYRGIWPTIGNNVFIAPGAMVIGDVRLGDDVSIWYNVVIRADTEPITIGARSNVQDNAVLHVDPGAPCIIGSDCTIGHSAVIHGVKVGDHVLMAMHCTVLSHTAIGNYVIVAAGALIGEHKTIPDHSLVMGVPGRVTRPLTDAELTRIHRNAAAYIALSQEHRASLRDAGIDLEKHL